MKFHRVKAEFPIDVVPCVHMSVVPLDQYHDPFSGFFGDFFSALHPRKPPTLSSRVTSTEPVRLTLEVPEKAAAATALVLRAMADELEGKL